LSYEPMASKLEHHLDSHQIRAGLQPVASSASACGA